ncbi:MAG: hypothetical protein ABIQ52_10105 [Vicinamibacterales bacterium]
MNESAGDRITELLDDGLQLADTDDVETLDDNDEEVRSSREGLPGSFRMRHDAHYVDELMSRTLDGSAPRDLDTHPRHMPDRPSMPRPADTPAPAPLPAETAAGAPAGALSLIAGRLESVVTHAGAMRSHQATPPLIAQSVHAEFARVARLAKAAAILQDRPTPIRRALTVRDIAESAKLTCAPVARMAGLDCDVTVADPAFTILAEAALVVHGVAGTVDAIVDLLLSDPRWPSIAGAADPAPRISISLQSVTIRPALIVDVICPSLFIGNRDVERFFDGAIDPHHTAPAAGILLAAAAFVVRAHGGRADVKRHNEIGATITFVYP